MKPHTILIVCIIVVVSAVFIAFKTNWAYKMAFSLYMKKMKYGTLIVCSRDGNTKHLEIVRSPLQGAKEGVIRVDDFGQFCKQIVLKGDIGLGELYMDGKWDSPDTFNMITTMVINDRQLQGKQLTTVKFTDKENIKKHYDIGNDMYESFLTDDFLAYSCGFFFKESDTLNDAQYNKVNTIIKKLDVNKNERILDIGCGWGKILKHIARETGAIVDGVTISDEQEKYIIENNPSSKVYNLHYEMLPIELNNTYDKIYSIGMFEHVRYKNYDKFFKKVNDLLKESGRLVLHTITYGSSIYTNVQPNNQNKTFISEYIFPGGQIPKREWIVDAASRNDFKLTHMEVFGGHHYGKTLRAWRKNLDDTKIDERILKMYEFYFLECETSFFLDRMNITHFIFDKIETLENADSGFHLKQ